MMTAKMSDKDTREDINKVFNLFDDDQTGHITLRNLKRVAKELGETMSGKFKRTRASGTGDTTPLSPSLFLSLHFSLGLRSVCRQSLVGDLFHLPLVG